MQRLFPIIILAGVIVIAILAPHRIAKNPDPNHTHADFAVWIDGKQLDFSKPEYMSSPPKDASASLYLMPTVRAHGDEEDSHVVPGREYLHSHDGNGHVIHRHKPGLTIGNFFKSIQVNISAKCYESFAPLADGRICGEHPFRMFVNGKEMPLNMDYVFEDLDQMLFTNAHAEEEVQKELEKLTNDACMYSKTCPERGEPPRRAALRIRWYRANNDEASLKIVSP